MRKVVTAIVLLGFVTACMPPSGEHDPVGAYQAIVAQIYGPAPIPATTFAIDASSTGLREPSKLVDALRADPHYASHEIVDLTRAALEDKGSISKATLSFRDGFLIEFIAPRIHGNIVVIQAEKWASGLDAKLATYTARWESGSWVVDDPKNVIVA